MIIEFPYWVAIMVVGCTFISSICFTIFLIVLCYCIIRDRLWDTFITGNHMLLWYLWTRIKHGRGWKRIIELEFHLTCQELGYVKESNK